MGEHTNIRSNSDEDGPSLPQWGKGLQKTKGVPMTENTFKGQELLMNTKTTQKMDKSEKLTLSTLQYINQTLQKVGALMRKGNPLHGTDNPPHGKDKITEENIEGHKLETLMKEIPVTPRNHQTSPQKRSE